MSTTLTVSCQWQAYAALVILFLGCCCSFSLLQGIAAAASSDSGYTTGEVGNTDPDLHFVRNNQCILMKMGAWLSW